jgi:hypothetical protein
MKRINADHFGGLDKKYPLVEVHWVDSIRYLRWRDHAKAENFEISVISTVGHLVGKTNHNVAVALSMDYDSVMDVISIPREAVRRIRRLK